MDVCDSVMRKSYLFSVRPGRICKNYFKGLKSDLLSAKNRCWIYSEY